MKTEDDLDLPVRPEHREALRGELLANFRARRPRSRARRWSSPYVGGLAVLAAAAGIAALSCAPSQYSVTIGTRIVFVASADERDIPSGRDLRAEVERLRPPGRVRVWALRDVRGETSIYVDVLDDAVDKAALVDRLQSDLPGLRRSKREIVPLEMTTRGLLIDRFGRLLHMRPAPKNLERARSEYAARMLAYRPHEPGGGAGDEP